MIVMFTAHHWRDERNSMKLLCFLHASMRAKLNSSSALILLNPLYGRMLAHWGDAEQETQISLICRSSRDGGRVFGFGRELTSKLFIYSLALKLTKITPDQSCPPLSLRFGWFTVAVAALQNLYGRPPSPAAGPYLWESTW